MLKCSTKVCHNVSLETMLSLPTYEVTIIPAHYCSIRLSHLSKLIEHFILLNYLISTVALSTDIIHK